MSSIPRWKALVALSSASVTLVGLGFVAGCTSAERPPVPGNAAPPPQTYSTSSKAVTPSISRDMPSEQRRGLADISTDGLCQLVTPDDLGRLVFPVQAGEPSETPPARGCTFNADTGLRSILIAAQPQGYGQVGRDAVTLGDGVPATETMHANDCTVFVDVAGAALQVTATAAESDSDQCEQAQSVAQYVLPTVAH